MAKQLTEQELRRQAVRALSDDLDPVDCLALSRLDFPRTVRLSRMAAGYFSQYNVDELVTEARKHRVSKVS